MAIQVLETGQYKKLCTKCNSLLKFSFTDIQEYKVNHDYLGDYDVVRGIKCPVCATVISSRLTETKA